MTTIIITAAVTTWIVGIFPAWILIAGSKGMDRAFGCGSGRFDLLDIAVTLFWPIAIAFSLVAAPIFAWIEARRIRALERKIDARTRKAAFL